MRHMVLEDLKGEFWPGALVDEAMAKRLEGRRVALIPADTELHKRNAVGGFFRRDWGAGWPMEPSVHRPLCPMVMLLQSGPSMLHWRVRVNVDKPTEDERLAGNQLTGQIRFSADSGQTHAIGGGLSSVGSVHFAFKDIVEPPDERGGWVIGGYTRLDVGMPNYHGFVLYGAGRGLRVVWAAISQTML